VQVVVYPPAKSFYELLTDEFSGNGDQMALSRFVSDNLPKAELEAVRVLRGPAAMFRPGELLALMPYTFLRGR